VVADKINLVTATLQAMAPYGWVLSGEPRDGEWRLSRNDETLYVNMNRHWLCLALPISVSPPPGPLFYGYLLRLSRRCFMGKYGLDGDGQVLLHVEIPLAGMERNYCRKAVEAIRVYAGRFREAISRAADETRGMVAIGEGNYEAPTPKERETEVFSLKTLAFYFKTVEHLGWHLRDRLAANHWHIAYKGPERSFAAFLSFNRSWAYFQMPMLAEVHLQQAQPDAHRTMFYSYLLELNKHIYWAKFGLDEEGQVLLMLELPVEAFDLRRFRQAVQTLATYADDFAYEVQIMARLDQDSHLATLLAVGDE